MEGGKGEKSRLILPERIRYTLGEIKESETFFKKGKDRHPAVRALPVRNWDMEELEFRYDTQLLIEGEDLDEDEIGDYIGDCLLAVGDDTLIKIHYHTNEPWKVLEYCASLGEIYDIVVEDMDRQSRGLQG